MTPQAFRRPLHGYELAFLKTGGVLVRDDGRHLVLMWLCSKGGRQAMATWDDDTLRAVQGYVQSVKAAEVRMCPDPGPCLNGPDPHQWHPSCQPDRDGTW